MALNLASQLFQLENAGDYYQKMMATQTVLSRRPKLTLRFNHQLRHYSKRRSHQSPKRKSWLKVRLIELYTVVTVQTPKVKNLFTTRITSFISPKKSPDSKSNLTNTPIRKNVLTPSQIGSPVPAASLIES